MSVAISYQPFLFGDRAGVGGGARVGAVCTTIF